MFSVKKNKNKKQLNSTLIQTSTFKITPFWADAYFETDHHDHPRLNRHTQLKNKTQNAKERFSLSISHLERYAKKKIF